MSLHKSNEILIQEELERCILHGLACQWEWALWVLDSSHKELMRKPLFSLGNMKNKLGEWSREKREICLSRNLVLNHPWDAVVEVLLHEMAHQFADEVLGASDEPPHGPTFQRACHLLRANPKASDKYEPLDERILRESSKSEDRIMQRVKKLMALAQSQNQHEAEAAMAKAHLLIGKYNVDLLAHEENRNFVSVFVGKPALRHFREEYALSRLLTDFYFVHGIWMPAYVMDKGKMGSVLEISGTIQNIKIAHYVYDFVRQSINSQWDEYNKDNGLNRYRKTDFAMGIIQGFSSKLKSQSETKRKVKDTCPLASRSGRRERALIKIEDPLLMKYAGYKYPRTISISGKALSHDHNVLKDGMSVGKKLVISKGITEKGKSRRLLIEDKKP
ncbi:MAG: DUF2786 domain-containing protein [Deltaproteobacteria bacterium]|nr:DUF2786 domain-containing protein [Deltaproteobacteria bacterium]MBW1793054.1 DUF2786 domain-containing protein [Deltaproteobacteria bacterium]MBW2329564.1 DUF2786 domain-containing protein [Deltaproteobacteria bacterium]